MKKYDKSALMLLLQDLVPFNMLTAKKCSKPVFFREWATQVFHSL